MTDLFQQNDTIKYFQTRTDEERQRQSDFLNKIVTPEFLEREKQKGQITAFETLSKAKKWGYAIPYVGTSAEIGNDLTILKLQNKIKEGRQLSVEETETYKDFVLDMASQVVRGQTIPSTGWDCILQSVPYMAEFGIGLATSGSGVGFASLGQTGGKIAVKKAVKDLTVKGIKDATKQQIKSQILKNTAKTLATDSTLGVAKFNMKYLPQQGVKRWGEVELDQNLMVAPEGQILLNEAEQNPATSVLKAIGLMQIETLSETAGFAFNAVGKALNKYIAPKLLKHLPEKFVKNLEKLNRKVTGLSTVKALQKYGWNGVLEEYGEERVSDFLQTTFDLDGEKGYSFEQFLTAMFPPKEQAFAELMAFSIMGGMGLGIKKGVDFANYKKISSNILQQSKNDDGTYDVDKIKRLVKKNNPAISDSGLEKIVSAVTKGISKTDDYSVDDFLCDSGVFRLYARKSNTDERLTEILQKNGMPDEEVENVLNNTSLDDKAELIRRYENNNSYKPDYSALKNDLINAGHSEEQAELEVQSLDRIDTILMDKYNAEGEAENLIKKRNLKIQNIQNQIQKSKEQNYINSSDLKQKEIYHFKPEELQTNAKVFQYKENSDEEGKTDRMNGVEEWSANDSGIVIVWQAKDGQKYIADGHQRLGLAKRLNDDKIRLDGILYKETDGYTPEDVRMIAAKKNIAEGSGTAIDTAKILREIGEYPASLSRKGTMYEYGIALARLGNEAFEKVINGYVTPAQGAVIANIIRNDHIKQSLAIDVVSQAGIDTLPETELMARQVLSTPAETVEQTSLFGTQEILQTSAVEKIKIIDSAIKILNKSKNLIAHLGNNQKQIEKNGNVLNQKNNEELKKSAEQAIEIVKKIAFCKGIISDKANELAQKKKNNEISHNDAVNQFVDFVMQDDILKIVFNDKNPSENTDNGQMAFFQSAYHGTPHKFDNFSTEHIGSGEGAQAHGWGLYFASNKDISENYRRNLTQSVEDIIYNGKKLDINSSEYETISAIWNFFDIQNDTFEKAKKAYIENYKGYTQSNDETIREFAEKKIKVAESIDYEKIKYNGKGQLYEVEIPENDELLDEDLPFSEQPQKVQEKLKTLFSNLNVGMNKEAILEEIESIEIEIEENENNDYIDLGQREYISECLKMALMHVKGQLALVDIENSNLKGQNIYKAISEHLDSDKLASEKLNEYGIKGIKYNGQTDGQCYVIFNPENIDITRTFYQEGVNPKDSIEQRTDKSKYLTDNEVEQLKKDKENFVVYVQKMIDDKLSPLTQIRVLEKLPSAYNKIPQLKGKKVVISQNVYKKIIDLPNKFNKNHNIDKKRALKLPEYLSDPLYILQSTSEGNEHRFVVVTASKGNKPKEKLSIILQPNNNVAVVSAYDEAINISEEKKNNRVLYDKKKELSKTLSASKAVTIDNSDTIITNSTGNFNSEQKTFQQDTKEPRAKIEFSKNETIISLMKGHDASSVMHELGHLYLHDIQQLAKTNKRAKNDLQEIYDTLGYNPADISEENLRNLHENFAKSFEAYLLNGESPTSRMKTIFEKFKEFLKDVYNSLSDIDVEFSTEVKEMFDKLFTTDEEYENEVLPLYEHNEELAEQINKQETLSYKIKDTLKSVSEAWKSFYDTIIIPIDTRLGMVSPELKKLLRKHTFNLTYQSKKDCDRIAPFLLKIKEIKKNNQTVEFKGKQLNAYNLLSFALNNRDSYTVNKVVKLLGIEKEFSEVRNLLEEIYEETISVGLEVGYLESYFPRMVQTNKKEEFIDLFEKMTKEEEIDLKKQLLELDEAEYSDVMRTIKENDPFGLWNSSDKAKLINISIRGFGKNNIMLSRIGQLKCERMIDKLTPEQQRFYEPIEKALTNYVIGARKNIEERKFFGAENKEVSKLRAVIKRKRETLRQVEKRTPQQAKWKELNRLKYELGPIEIKIESISGELEKNLKRQSDVKDISFVNSEEAEKLEGYIKHQKELLTDLNERSERLKSQIKWVEENNDDKVKNTIVKRLNSEIVNTTKQIQEILGDIDHVEDSVGRLIVDLAEKGVIHVKDEKVVRDLLASRFNSLQLEKVAITVRDVSTIVTLNDITNAITQISDLTFSAFKFGLWNTFQGMRKVEGLTREDLGLNHIAEEFRGASGVSAWLNAQLKIIGLDLIDGFAKNTEINASIYSARQKVKKNDKNFIEKLNFLFGDELSQKVQKDLIENKITDEIIFIAFNDLADIQPITTDQMTRGYQSAFKPWYVLKTYSIKALDIVRNDCFSKITIGMQKLKTDKAEAIALLSEGVGNLIKLQLFLWLFGLPQDLLKDLVGNREFDIPEHVIDNLLIFGVFNRFLVNKVAKNPANIYLENMKMPAIQAACDLWTGINQVRKGKKEVKDLYVWSRVPIVGKLYYNWLGGKKEKRVKFN